MTCGCPSSPQPSGPLTIAPGCRVYTTDAKGITIELAEHDGTGIVYWPDLSLGHHRFRGIAWGGTPAPRRWWARLTRRPIAIVPGCGCIIILRTWWERIRTLSVP